MQKFNPGDEITEAVDEITKKFAGEDGLSGFEAMTGYFTILHLSPVTLQVSKWMPVITGDYEYKSVEEKKADENLLKEFHKLTGKHIENYGITLPHSVTIETENPAGNQQNKKLSDWIMGIMNGVALINPLIEDVLSTDDEDLEEAEEILDESLLGLQLLVPGPETDEILKETEAGRDETLRIITSEFDQILEELTEVLTFFRFNYPVAG